MVCDGTWFSRLHCGVVCFLADTLNEFSYFALTESPVFNKNIQLYKHSFVNSVLS